MYSGVSSDYEGCRLDLRGINWSLGSIAHDSHGNAKCEIPLQRSSEIVQRPLIQSLAKSPGELSLNGIIYISS